MTSWGTVKSEPEKYGLEIVAQLDDPCSCYDFDSVIVWRVKETNTLVWAESSGCSCPAPFEEFDKIEDLTSLTDFHEFFDDVEKSWCPYSRNQEQRTALTEFLAEVRNLL
jgi:hypothetical protein